jgi:hypothetical protein
MLLYLFAAFGYSVVLFGTFVLTAFMLFDARHANSTRKRIVALTVALAGFAVAATMMAFYSAVIGTHLWLSVVGALGG